MTTILNEDLEKAIQRALEDISEKLGKPGKFGIKFPRDPGELGYNIVNRYLPPILVGYSQILKDGSSFYVLDYYIFLEGYTILVKARDIISYEEISSRSSQLITEGISNKSNNLLLTSFGIIELPDTKRG